MIVIVYSYKYAKFYYYSMYMHSDSLAGCSDAEFKFTNGCCVSGNCSVILNDSSVCYCDQSCHEDDSCCGDIIEIGCIREFLIIIIA